MIAAVVPERKPGCFRPGGTADQLVTHADAKDGETIEQGPRHPDRALQLRRVARTIGEDDRLGMASKHGLEVAIPGHDLYLHTSAAQRPQRVSFDAVVDDDDPEAGPLPQAPTLPAPGWGGRLERRVERLDDVHEAVRDLAHQILLFEWRDALHPFAQQRQFVTRPDHRTLRPRHSQVTGHAAAIATGQDGNAAS